MDKVTVCAGATAVDVTVAGLIERQVQALERRDSSWQRREMCVGTTLSGMVGGGAGVTAVVPDIVTVGVMVVTVVDAM